MLYQHQIQVWRMWPPPLPPTATFGNVRRPLARFFPFIIYNGPDVERVYKQYTIMLFGRSHELLAIFACSGVLGTHPNRQKKPNLVMALADDLGFSDVGWVNSNLITPTLDALAKDGVILNRHYVFSYCSPTRGTSLLVAA
jgi:hypothetical protein